MLLRFSFSQKYQFYFISSEKRQSGDWLSEGDLLQTERPQEEVEGYFFSDIQSIFMNIFLSLKVSFVGEPGLDMGGLTKEWFQLLIKQIFDAEYGMFVYHTHSR